MDRSFCYSPLDGPDSIRLLQFLSPNGSDPLSCSLLTARLDEKPSYEALSYCWGGGETSSIIQCNGRDLTVTANLYRALRSLQRLEDSACRLFWVDAVCINQGDISERNSQVLRMHQIYSTAKRDRLAWRCCRSSCTRRRPAHKKRQVSSQQRSEVPRSASLPPSLGLPRASFFKEGISAPRRRRIRVGEILGARCHRNHQFDHSQRAPNSPIGQHAGVPLLHCRVLSQANRVFTRTSWYPT